MRELPGNESGARAGRTDSLVTAPGGRAAGRRGLLAGAVACWLRARDARAAPALRVRVAGEDIDAGDGAAVAAAIARANAGARVEGLDDGLNPALLDPARVLAMIAAMPATAVTALEGFALDLAAPSLPVRTTSPATPAGFAALEGIVITGVEGGAAQVQLFMPLDCALARDQAAAAKAALVPARAEVERLEAAPGGPPEALALARRRRFAIAGTWHENAQAASFCAPGDAAAAAELAAAAQAQATYAPADAAP